MKRVLDYNPLTGEACVFHSNGSQIAIENVQDYTRIIERNKKLAANSERTRAGVKKDMIHYASIPNGLILKWKQELGIDVFDPNHRKSVFKLLNSPEYRYLKTTELTHAG